MRKSHLKLNLSRFTLACAGLLLAASASAQTAGGSAGTSGVPSPTPAARPADAARDSKLARGDAAFLKQAAQNGHTEIEGSKLAQSKATHEKVKAFAQQMIEDHTKMHGEVSTLAASKGVELPDGPSIPQKAKLKLLSTADGASFDRRYADSIGVKAHEDTVKLFEKASRDAKDPEVKALAVKALPSLKHHLQMARDLKAQTDKSPK